MNQLISELRAYDKSIDATQIADALWLANVMGQGSAIIDDELTIEEKQPNKAKGSDSSSSLPRDVIHRVVISAQKKEEPKSQMSLENSGNSSFSYGVTVNQKKQLPKIEKQFRALKVKKNFFSKEALDETKTAEYIATTGFFHPIFKEHKSKQNHYGLHIIIDQSKSMFLWQEKMEHFLQSIRFSRLFNGVKIFELDSSQPKATLRHYGSKQPLDVNASVLKEKQTLTLVFSDIVGASWKSSHLFELLEQWSQNSFVAIVSMLPEQMWQRTSLRKGVKLFMNAKRPFPTNADLKAEFDFLERKLGEYSSRIPVLPFSEHSFLDLSQVLVSKKESWIDTRVFKQEPLLLSNKKVENKTLEAKERVENFFASALPETRYLAIYCSVLPLNKEIIQEVIDLKALANASDVFSEFYFGGLIYKERQAKLGEYSFYQGVRQLLLEYISMEEAKRLFEQMESVVSRSLGLNISMIELLFEHSQKQNELSETEIELVKLLIEILAEKGNYYQKDIDRLQPLADVVRLKTNTYQMGSNDGRDNEKPIHTISFDYDFEIAKTPVTFEEYDLYCEDTNTKKPSDEGWGRGKRPVINVSWHDAQNYCKWISKKMGKEYRLPTEAEWEYACRAGTTTKWSFGDNEKELDTYAWYDKNSYDLGKEHKDYGTHIVGEKLPNPWGLYDMHGNVWEWCQDDWVDNYNDTPRDGTAYKKSKDSSKVVRGGSWSLSSLISRSAYRSFRNPTDRVINRGFRLLRTLP